MSRTGGQDKPRRTITSSGILSVAPPKTPRASRSNFRLRMPRLKNDGHTARDPLGFTVIEIDNPDIDKSTRSQASRLKTFPFAFLLPRHRLARTGKLRFGKAHGFILCESQRTARIRKYRPDACPVIESESGCQVAERIPAPLSYVRFSYARKFLEELKHRCMIEFLAADPAARGPRGHNYAWNPENGTYRFPVHEFVRRARFWDGWRNMVEESVVLVEDQNSPKAIDSITRRMRFTADQLDRRAD